MRKLAFIFIFLIFLFLAFPAKAYDPSSVDNNIYGIGIINLSDLADVSNLVNTNGGDWGYVTVVITEEQKNKEIWQNFFDDCRRLHIIPIVRIATKFDGTNWEIAKIEKIDSWVNFFSSLNWVIENRYIIIGNEPNHAKEWGGTINPSEYAIYLKTFTERLHNANPDYFVLNAGFDQSATNTKITMDQQKYIQEMVKKVPDVFNFIDGWASHSYPNPGFSGSKNGSGRRSIKGYEWELALIKRDLPIFVTETGWIRLANSEERTANSMKYAYEEIWSKNPKIVVVTPFILNYQEEPFYEFSWKNKNGSFFEIYNEIQSLQKIKGEPVQKISGEIIFNFLNPISFNGIDQKGFSLVKNTGQATWTQSESQVINESENEIKVSNTKLNLIEPFKSGLVIYTLKTPDSGDIFNVKLGFYVRGVKIGDVFNGKIIKF